MHQLWNSELHYYQYKMIILYVSHICILTSLTYGQLWPNGQRVVLVSQRLWVGALGPAGIVVVESECTVLSSILNTMTEVRPLSKALNPQLLPGCCSTWLPTAPCVCLHLDELNEYGSPYLATRYFNHFMHAYVKYKTS